MNALILHWHDAGKDKTQQIDEQINSKNHGTVRIGRDPLRCDIVLSHPTVSGLHVEIFFYPQQQSFFIRNLREQNPPLVDGRQLVHGEMPLSDGTKIFLGQQELKVTLTSNIPPTIIVTPQVPPAVPVGQPPFSPASPPQHQQPQAGHYHNPQTPVAQPQGDYGLECPKCHRISSVEYLQIGCRWCGTSLAAAVSVLVAPNNLGSN
ncbi:FHA domain-containing protein [Iningainema tapete]|uniref:FHA domain-containing protein n=1 Tax=Iningainema tapete BLCC-T55 TaxID=2748662 RepID=A0A8J6XHD1_9CYAN|nr:FHA domain-containing protein [Iningainema tapete]MBD2770601.1 FHA domain-containing protein [Iningainema tapete BLCC-T55]